MLAAAVGFDERLRSFVELEPSTEVTGASIWIDLGQKKSQ